MFNSVFILGEKSNNHLDILNSIFGITISATGTSTNSIEAPKAYLDYVLVRPDSILFVISVSIPSMGIKKTISTDGYYTEEGGNLSIVIDHDIHAEYGQYTTSAKIRLRSFVITPKRNITLFGNPVSGSYSVNDGYNVGIDYDDNSATLSITGGPGLGKGQYKGSTCAYTADLYKGLKSINGIRFNRNIDINMSDVLIEHGAKCVYEEKK